VLSSGNFGSSWPADSATSSWVAVADSNSEPAGTTTFSTTFNLANAQAAQGEVLAGLWSTGSIAGTGELLIDDASTLELGGGSGEAVTFADPGTLKLDSPTAFAASNQGITGLQVGDTIDLVNTKVTSAVLAGTTLTVHVSGGADLVFNNVTGPGGATIKGSFQVQSDGGGSDLVLIPTVPDTWLGPPSGKPGVILGGVWNASAANWSTGIPTTASDAILRRSRPRYRARPWSSMATNTGGKIKIAAGATIEADGGALGTTISGAAVSGAGTLLATNNTTLTLAGTSVTGSTLKTTNGGTITTLAGTTNALDGGAIIPSGTTLNVVAGSTLMLKGSNTNNGAIDVNGTTLAVGGSAALNGTGTVTFTDSLANAIVASGATSAKPFTFTNAGNIILGAGTIGNNGDGTLSSTTVRAPLTPMAPTR
jgi:hypothetical protein